MILSASRRTDIPCHYSEWLINRLQAGYVLTRNPMNPSQIYRIPLSKDIIDCIVFWTKDPLNMLDKLDTLDELDYKYYFYFTLTPYDRSVERKLRDKEDIVRTFKELSRRIGHEKTVWRYDPIILNETFDFAYHKEKFSYLCKQLENDTNQCIVSFVDLYSKLKKDRLREIRKEEMMEISRMISTVAKDYGITVKACCEESFLSECGMEKASCIDKALIEKICGYGLDLKKDKNQRHGCECYESVDIGAYNTCKNGCIYCYANYSMESVEKNDKRHDPKGELLIGEVQEYEKVILKDVKSNVNKQMKLF
ncbi:MAG: DUF1848 domain-containing protein [Clostridia bacterium]|jgi:hypothetical protein